MISSGKHGSGREYDGTRVTGGEDTDTNSVAEGQDIVHIVSCTCSPNDTNDTNDMYGAYDEGVADCANDAGCSESTDGVICSDGAGGEDGADITRNFYNEDSRKIGEIVDREEESMNVEKKYGIPREQFSGWELFKHCRRRE